MFLVAHTKHMLEQMLALLIVIMHKSTALDAALMQHEDALVGCIPALYDPLFASQVQVASGAMALRHWLNLLPLQLRLVPEIATNPF